MLTWLLLGTVVYVLTLFVPSFLLLPRAGLSHYLGSRDNDPEAGAVHGRAQRACRNFIENYPIFMGLGILALVVPEADLGLATTGAMLFVLARVAYLPLYLLAVPYVRSLAFMVGWVGTLMIGIALI